MIDNLYDKTSKISFSVYGTDFLKYFGEYKNIIRELATEVDTLYGTHRRLDKLVLVDDDTLQNWEFQVKTLGDDELLQSWQYNHIKSAQTGKIMDSFIISFANPVNCKEKIKIGRVICFAPIIKYLRQMGLHEKFKNIENKVKHNIPISVFDELTLIFVSLATDDRDKEEMVKRVCAVLDKIDYVDNYRRVVIDSLISFQIENFVKSQNDKNRLNEVVDMQLSVEELFVQVEREAQYDNGFEHGWKEGKSEGKDEIIINMLEKSVSEDIIKEYVGCSLDHIRKLKREFVAGK